MLNILKSLKLFKNYITRVNMSDLRVWRLAAATGLGQSRDETHQDYRPHD